jgi:hypothetical protein
VKHPSEPDTAKRLRTKASAQTLLQKEIQFLRERLTRATSSLDPITVGRVTTTVNKLHRKEYAHVLYLSRRLQRALGELSTAREAVS